MKEILLKYDSICISDNEIEFHRIHNPSLGKILYDVFVNAISFVYLYIPFFYLLMKLLGISISCIYMLGLFFMILFYAIMLYRKKHKNIKIPIDQIFCSFIKKRILYVHYKGGVRLAEIGDDKTSDQLQELSTLKLNSTSYNLNGNRRKKIYKQNAWLGAAGICLSGIFLVVIGEMNEDNDMSFILGLVSFVICISIFLWGIVNMKIGK